MHIDGGGVGFGQVGQLEIVGSKQAEGFVFAAGVRQRHSRGRGRRKWKYHVRLRPLKQGFVRWRDAGCRRFRSFRP